MANPTSTSGVLGHVFTPVTCRMGQRDMMIRAFCAPEFPQYGVGHAPPEAGPTVTR